MRTLNAVFNVISTLFIRITFHPQKAVFNVISTLFIRTTRTPMSFEAALTLQKCAHSRKRDGGSDYCSPTSACLYQLGRHQLHQISGRKTVPLRDFRDLRSVKASYRERIEIYLRLGVPTTAATVQQNKKNHIPPSTGAHRNVFKRGWYLRSNLWAGSGRPPLTSQGTCADLLVERLPGGRTKSVP